MSSLHARPSSDSNTPIALATAVVAAGVGMLAWAGISYVTEYEIGYMAWGVGLLVGFATARMGGRGAGVAAAAAVLTLASIFAGKLLSTQMLVEKGFAESSEEVFTRAFYDELRRDAADWALVSDPTDEEEVGLFIVEHGYAEAGDPSELTKGDFKSFAAVSVPALEQLSADQPSFEEWRDGAVAESRAAFEAENTLVGLVVGELNGIDAIFAVLAVTTAFGLVSRAGSGSGDSGQSSGGEQYRRAA